MPEFPRAVVKGAQQLLQAQRRGLTIDLLTTRWPDLNLSQAEAIALETVRLSEQPVVGFKLGFTSAAMREQMNIASANFGRLTVDMDVTTGSAGNRFVHPRIEPEVAIVLGKNLGGIDLTLEVARDAVESVHASLEIVDTRYHDYRFTLVDNTADNSSAAGFVLGPPHRPADLLDRPLAVTLASAGAPVAQGSSSAAMGGPLQATLWLAQELGKRGLSIPAGAIILTGGLTQAPRIEKHQEFSATFAELGTVSYRS